VLAQYGFKAQMSEIVAAEWDINVIQLWGAGYVAIHINP
jgi:hypothetical protein